jgi:hypothetical protein
MNVTATEAVSGKSGRPDKPIVLRMEGKGKNKPRRSGFRLHFGATPAAAGAEVRAAIAVAARKRINRAMPAP